MVSKPRDSTVGTQNLERIPLENEYFIWYWDTEKFVKNVLGRHGL